MVDNKISEHTESVNATNPLFKFILLELNTGAAGTPTGTLSAAPKLL